jgi:peptide/nickel transport system substrate-binding protein
MESEYRELEALVSAFARGRIGRRAFLKKAIALGLTIPALPKFLDEVADPASAASQADPTLVIGAAATPTTLDPEFASSPQDREVDVCTYDRFSQFKITHDSAGNAVADLKAPVEPLLAESWQISSDGRKYTITLKRGVKSFFGNELTADDIKWSWDRVFGLNSQGLFPLGVASIRSKSAYQVTGRYTMEITLSEPNPLLMIVQATPVPGAAFYDSTEVKKHASADDPWARRWLASHTASFGPYHAKSFTPGQQVEYVANPNYFRGKPAVDRVIYREVPSSASRLTLLRAGAIDIAEDLLVPERMSLKGAAGVKVINIPGNFGAIVGLNNSIAPFTDKRVRQAIAYAMPVDDIIKTVYFNDPTVRLFKGPVPDQYPGYPSYWPYQPRDINKAKGLLAAAGQGSGFGFDLTYTLVFPEQEQIAELIRTGLRDIGVDVRLQKLTPAQYQEQYYGHKAQAVIVQDAPFVADGAYAEFLYFGPGKGAVGNWINYRDKSVQDLIMESLGTPNLEQRYAKATGAARGIVDDVPWAMYLGTGFHLAMRSDVTGFVWRPHNLIEFDDLRKGM